MSRPKRVYVRFVCFRLVESQRQRLGLFQALDEARDCDFAPSWALGQIGELSGWFKQNLAAPSKFSRGSWKGRGQPGLSWFKPVATEHISQMHQLKLALEACGVHVEILTTRDPGHILWQDEHQLVAERTQFLMFAAVEIGCQLKQPRVLSYRRAILLGLGDVALRTIHHSMEILAPANSRCAPQMALPRMTFLPLNAPPLALPHCPGSV